MKVINKSDNLERKEMLYPNVKHAFMKVLIGPDQGWGDHVMRQMELEAGGYSPLHAHPWPHINYVVSGQGTIEMDGEIQSVTAGDYAFIPADTIHQFKNSGDKTFTFLCIVPKDGHK